MSDNKVTKRKIRNALDQSMLTTGFTVGPGDVTGTQIGFEYDTMPGNQPNTNANTVFIWQTNQIAVPVSQAPDNTWTVLGNESQGSNVFTKLSVTQYSYLLGYGVGPAVKNICATVFVPAQGAGNPTSQTPSLLITGRGANSLSYSYVMPQGSQPTTNGDWVGIWEGQGESALYSLPPKWFAQVPQDFYQGSGAVNGLTILRGTPYCLGYFKGGFDKTTPKQSTLACSQTFSG